jgi:hypothetical protein
MASGCNHAIGKRTLNAATVFNRARNRSTVSITRVEIRPASFGEGLEPPPPMHRKREDASTQPPVACGQAVVVCGHRWGLVEMLAANKSGAKMPESLASEECKTFRTSGESAHCITKAERTEFEGIERLKPGNLYNLSHGCKSRDIVYASDGRAKHSRLALGVC